VISAITIVGSSVAINEAFAPRFALVLPHMLERDDENFAITDSGRLWQIVASQTQSEQNALAKKHTAIELLQSWRAGNPTEQRSTLEFLKTALDENRTSGNKLFERD
jgi:hypothetical protein